MPNLKLSNYRFVAIIKMTISHRYHNKTDHSEHLHLVKGITFHLMAYCDNNKLEVTSLKCKNVK